MSVSYEDAIATLQSMFPEWDKGTLGTYKLLSCDESFSIVIVMVVSGAVLCYKIYSN